MELPQKVEAILARLISQAAFAAPVPLIFAGENDQDITQQAIIAVCHEAEREEPEFSGNMWHPVSIELQTPSRVLTAAEVANNIPTALVLHQAAAAVLEGVVMIENLPDLINAAALALGGPAAAFTAFGVTDRRYLRSQDQSLYLSGFSLRLYCCSKNVQ